MESGRNSRVSILKYYLFLNHHLQPFICYSDSDDYLLTTLSTRIIGHQHIGKYFAKNCPQLNYLKMQTTVPRLLRQRKHCWVMYQLTLAHITTDRPLSTVQCTQAANVIVTTE